MIQPKRNSSKTWNEDVFEGGDSDNDDAWSPEKKNLEDEFDDLDWGEEP